MLLLETVIWNSLIIRKPGYFHPTPISIFYFSVWLVCFAKKLHEEALKAKSALNKHILLNIILPSLDCGVKEMMGLYQVNSAANNCL